MKTRNSKPACLAGMLSLALVAATAVPASAQSSKTILATVEGMRAGGKTIAGPGVYSHESTAPTSLAQFGSVANVCVTVTLVSGTQVQATLRDQSNGGIQNVSAIGDVRTAAACGDGVMSVELACGGADPCVAVWRVDAR